MAATFTKAGDGDNVDGRNRTVTGDLALDNSYPTGGYSLTAAKFGIRKIGSLRVVGIKGTLANSGALMFSWDAVNNKLMAFYPSGGAAAPGALAAPAAAAPAIGTLAATATPAAGGTPVTSTGAQPAIPVVFTGTPAAPALTAGRGLEVGNATNLSTITLRIVVGEN